MASKFSSTPVGKRIPLPDQADYAEKFSPIVDSLDKKRIAKQTGLSIETVKAWGARRAFANGASLLNCAKVFPLIKMWLIAEIDSYDGTGISDDVTKALFEIERFSRMPGPTGDRAREALLALHTKFSGKSGDGK